MVREEGELISAVATVSIHFLVLIIAGKVVVSGLKFHLGPLKHRIEFMQVDGSEFHLN
jgi:hypothetical protein